MIRSREAHAVGHELLTPGRGTRSKRYDTKQRHNWAKTCSIWGGFASVRGVFWYGSVVCHRGRIFVAIFWYQPVDLRGVTVLVGRNFGARLLYVTRADDASRLRRIVASVKTPRELRLRPGRREAHDSGRAPAGRCQQVIFSSKEAAITRMSVKEDARLLRFAG